MKLESKLYYLYAAFLIIYACFTLIPKPLKSTLVRYHLSVTGARLIDLTVILIVAFIWFAGFYGYERLNRYAGLIHKDKDGKQVRTLSRGLLFIVLWLPVSSTVSSVTNYYVTKHPGASSVAGIINNYINLLLPLVGFIYISVGARRLSELAKWRPTQRAINVLVILIIYVSVIYYRLVLTTHNRALVYHMSVWPIMLTLIAPYVYMWFIGLLAAYEIYCYHRKSQGIVYRQIWRLLAYGLAWLILTSILFQYLTSLSSRLDKLSIYWILAIIYSLLLVLSVGFVLIALGARKLQKIEEV